MSGQRVTVLGPNLSKAGQDKGEFHVHAEGCEDIRRDPKRYGYANERPWTIEVGSLEDVVEATYGDIIDERPEGVSEAEEIQSLMHSFHFAPCVTLGHAEEGGA